MKWVSFAHVYKYDLYARYFFNNNHVFLSIFVFGNVFIVNRFFLVSFFFYRGSIVVISSERRRIKPRTTLILHGRNSLIYNKK